MRVGLALPQYDSSVPGEQPLRWETVARWAQTADHLGFGSLWLSDHLFIDTALFGGPPARVAALDPLPGLSAVARLTRRARLGTLVLCTPLRPPSIVAKALSTLDVVSGGRVVAGLGTGWYAPEFRAAGVPFEPAGRRLEGLAEAIDTMRMMWAGGGAPCLPRPLQPPGPPVWVGGRRDRLLGLVARHADGWNAAWVSTPDSYRERSAFLDRACERAGRDPGTVARSVGLHTLVGEDGPDLARRFERLRRLSPPGTVRAASLDEYRRGRLVGTVDEVRQQVVAWAGAGVTELIVNAGAMPFHVTGLDDLPLIAKACSLETSWEASELRN